MWPQSKWRTNCDTWCDPFFCKGWTKTHERKNSKFRKKPMIQIGPNNQSCIKFKKFNSSSVHGIELSSQLKFSSFDKNWTWTAAQLTIELFWTEFKVNSERVECPLVEKRRNWAFSMSWHTKFCSSFPFLVGGTPLSLNWLWTQFKKVQWWVEQQFKFSFWSMNWIWIDHQVQGKNWIELRTSIQFWTAIQLCILSKKYFLSRKISYPKK